MNERHSEMMNQINAGTDRPVTASGQLGAVRVCHGGGGRGMVRNKSGVKGLFRLFFLTAMILVLGATGLVSSAEAAINLVNTPVSGNSTNGGNVILALTGARQGDVVVVYGGNAYTGAAVTAGITTTGYTQLSLQNVTGVSFGVWYKVMGTTPDANVVGRGTANNADVTAYGAYILRGIDSAITDATTVNATGTNTIPNCGPITTVTNGALVLALAANNANDATSTAPTNYANNNGATANDTNDVTTFGATRTIDTAATEDPAAWTGWTVGTVWRAATVALKPDATAPTVTGVTSSTLNGTYGVGTVIPIQVNFSEPVDVTGTPQLTLSTGSPATTVINYTSGSGTSTLTFNYTVASGNTSADLDYSATNALALNGGTITDGGGNAATLTLAAPSTANSLGANKALVIDGIAPTVTINQAGAQADPTGSTPINFTVVFSESVTNFATGDVTIAGTAGGTKTATVTGSGTTYNVAVTGMTTAGTVIASINAGVATDAVGNPNAASTSTDNSVSWTVGPVCTRNAPTFSITPATQNVKTNQSVVYTLTVTNNDTVECADSSTFNVAITSETGDTADFTLPSMRSATSVSVAAGASNSTVTLTVTSAAAAVDGKALTSLLTISDAVNHSGMNQTDSMVTTVANFNPMIHSSKSTNSTKWLAQGGWGVAGGQYGEFKCETCHVRGATNIKRILTPITVTGTPRNVDFQDATAGPDVAIDPADFGDDSDSRGATPSERICEVCHTQTSYHRVTVDATPSLTHFNKTDCISCHKHNSGFDASCTTCHPTYPEPPATNAHVTHAGSAGYAYDCTVCHPLDHDGTAADITFTGVAATWAGATYTSADKTCSSLYCHGSVPADWDAGTGGACGDCHGAAITGRPNGVGEPTGGSHLTGSHQAAACTACHSHDGTDKTEHVNGPASANGDALVSSAGTSITTYTYGTTLSSSPDPDGYKYSGGTCATSCHSDGVWGGSGGCTFCHGGSGLYYPQGASAPNRIAEHADHIYALETKLGYTHGTTDDAQQKVMCAYCHNDTNGIGGIGHNDGGVAEVGAFNPMWNGAAADSDSALMVGKTCSNIDCHYSTTTADTWYGAGTATCTYCHAGDAVYAAGSLPGVHDAHVDEVADGGRDKTCVTCHSSSATYANDHANGSSGTEVAFSGSTTYSYNDTNNTCGSATNNGLGCHATGTPDWDVPFAITVCTNCHTNTTNTAVNPTSGLHAAGPTVSGQAHNQTLGGSGCASCHTVAALSTHANGAFTGNGTTDRTQMGLPATAGNGYTATANDVGSCVGSWLTGCHTGAGDQGTWARKWDASIHYDPSDGDLVECAGCHGGFNNDWTFGSAANTTDGSVEHNRNWDGDATSSEVIGNHSNNTDKKCNICHVYGDAVYVMGTHHRNGQITMNSTMGYQRTTTTPNYGCTNTCHSSNTNHGMENSNWTLGTLAGPSLSCTSCHTGSGSGAFKVGSASTHVIRGTRAGMNTFNSCNDCHPEHTGGVLVPNNAAVGVNYTAGGRTGFRIGGTATTGTTEAEICWNCHGNTTTYQTTVISEWGTNTKQTGAPAPLAAFNYGTVSTPNWTTATWTSAQSTLFAYKTGAIQSTHSANSAGTSTVTATAGYFTETKDSVANIRCSYCHDVHNTASGVVAGDVSGKPFLRGSWWTNPYKEDGAPTGAYNAYSTTPVYGAVPRGYSATLNANNTAYGGWQIDQNNNNPTVATGYTGVNWTYANSAGLCALCHTSTVNGMNWNTTENGGASLWVGTNGHNNAVIGGTGTSAANIYSPATRNEGTTATNPKMGYQLGNTARQYGVRNNNGNNNVTSNGTTYIGATADGVGVYPYAGVGATAQVRYAYETSTGTGNTGVWGVDQSTTTAQTQYHKFSCSKCHNPHASRLPKLMITNCLDVSHNTWDDKFINDGDWTGGNQTWSTVGIFPTGTETAGNNKEFAYAKSAQNCHRFIDNNGNGTITTGDTGGDEPGWNKVTPWK